MLGLTADSDTHTHMHTHRCNSFRINTLCLQNPAGSFAVVVLNLVAKQQDFHPIVSEEIAPNAAAELLQEPLLLQRMSGSVRTFAGCLEDPSADP